MLSIRSFSSIRAKLKVLTGRKRSFAQKYTIFYLKVYDSFIFTKKEAIPSLRLKVEYRLVSPFSSMIVFFQLHDRVVSKSKDRLL